MTYCTFYAKIRHHTTTENNKCIYMYVKLKEKQGHYGYLHEYDYYFNGGI